MVKISDLKEERHTNMKRNQPRLLPPDPATPQKKDKSVQMRLTKAVVDQLRLYAEEHNTSVTNAVEQIVIEKFMNKQLTRHFFNLDEPATILIPISDTLLALYTKDCINMIAKIVETSAGAFTIKTFDKQVQIFKNFSDELDIMEVYQVSNVFDSYDVENQCYYSIVGLQEGEDPFLNHDGLIMVTHEDFDPEQNIQEILTVLIRVSVYNGTLRNARIITKEEAIKLAERVNNQDLVEYIQAIEDEITQIKHIVEVRNNEIHLNSQIEQLLEEKKQLEDQIASMKSNDTDYLHTKIRELQEENKKLKNGFNYADEILEEQVTTMFEAMMDSIKSSRTIDKVRKRTEKDKNV